MQKASNDPLSMFYAKTNSELKQLLSNLTLVRIRKSKQPTDKKIYENKTEILKTLRKEVTPLPVRPNKHVFLNTTFYSTNKPYQHMHADLADMLFLKKPTKYVLVIVDIFSQFVYFFILKNKNKASMIEAFDTFYYVLKNKEEKILGRISRLIKVSNF